MSQWGDSKQYVEVLGRRMAYVEQGTGDPIVLLHGNPTSSYLWHSVIPELTGKGRCIAPDLIGMGDSDKLPGPNDPGYTLAGHQKFVDAFLDAVLGDTEKVVLVIHDWGSALGFDWARRHPGRVRGIAYMEAIVRPLDSWDEWPEAARRIFQGLRSEAGEDMVLNRNLFVEAILPNSIKRKLSDEEMNEYRRPFANPGEERRPTLTWPRQIPIEGQPPQVVRVVGEYADYFASTPGIPKLFINADPGIILVGAQREFCRSWPDQTEITVSGLHFIQEDSGPEIGRAVAAFIDDL
ncbi:haloalkane dehalogenase [Mycobacterium intermedium]|uniref:Haloalkane dehalogenase n=1 Tax=Mycobacterium intermedium TaxID=28445 RepID=A0A1E3SIW4_MYCIE|nr:haloalkane dehalogenase [Mycobacterium intermedium]MCV6963281.1 haloalkane dehalogenase [Mycobacterium intermedium]ODR01498.1 haloalkane dehalogenase [Mycobacterium intermedium]OPE47445.1 haloalkane dehalogenase [Mycobacterium intermedium]ORA95965.1 haloalkane dehalogenase [Mycobacterium intermedium]